MKLYEKYLRVDEAAKAFKGKKKEEALEKVVKTIRSAKTLDQLKMGQKMMAVFMKNFKDDWRTEELKNFYGLPATGKYYKTMKDVLKDQEERIRHMMKQSQR